MASQRDRLDPISATSGLREQGKNHYNARVRRLGYTGLLLGAAVAYPVLGEVLGGRDFYLPSDNLFVNLAKYGTEGAFLTGGLISYISSRFSAAGERQANSALAAIYNRYFEQ